MNRFLDKILIIIAMLSLGYVNLSAQSYDNSYKAVYSGPYNRSFNKFVKSGSYKNIIGDSLSRHIIWGYPSKEKFPKLGAKLVKELNLAEEDTVTIVAFQQVHGRWTNVTV